MSKWWKAGWYTCLNKRYLSIASWAIGTLNFLQRKNLNKNWASKKKISLLYLIFAFFQNNELIFSPKYDQKCFITQNPRSFSKSIQNWFNEFAGHLHFFKFSLIFKNSVCSIFLTGETFLKLEKKIIIRCKSETASQIFREKSTISFYPTSQQFADFFIENYQVYKTKKKTFQKIILMNREVRVILNPCWNFSAIIIKMKEDLQYFRVGTGIRGHVRKFLESWITVKIIVKIRK